MTRDRLRARLRRDAPSCLRSGQHSVDESPADHRRALAATTRTAARADARERLILHYSPLVKFVAGRVAAGLPQNIEQSDLVSYGIFGLIDAIDKFDPGRGFKFETYAISRIKGAIIDELRSIDWVPRSVRAKARVDRAGVLEARERAAAQPRRHRGRRRARHDRGRARHALLGQISFIGLVALDELLTAGAERGSGATVGDTIADGGHDPVEAFESDEMRTCSPTRSTACPTASGSCSRSTTTRASRSPRSATCSASPRAACARSTPRRSSSSASRLSEPLPERGLVT